MSADPYGSAAEVLDAEDDLRTLIAPRPARHRPVDPSIARSWLLAPGTRPDSFSEMAASRADAVVLDIEDAVDPRNKPQARQDVAEWLRGGGRAWVRVNDALSPFWADDLAALAGIPTLLGIMLAKTESPDHVTSSFDRLGGNVPVVALIESAIGMEDAAHIARARGAFRLAFGSGDFRRDTGMSADAEAMAYPRARLVVASRVGDLPGPIDGPTVGNSMPTLREHSAITVSMGMTGKLCLAAEQAPVINEVISPTPSEVEWAMDFLSDFESRGRVVRDGSDLPRLGRAQKIEKLAIAFGVHPSS
ncbi:aldolase/citrate lyase family protein [Microbacterium sp. M3]|uniref:Aldolase/citrate lyase family protein n=1 Tax=Microbacterium arthrosphaerae TaxID=792652 RepID=A0ABU4GY84_9MICO|nr:MULTISPECIES: aldolase/citrate lyase family protein [Microbacterium]MDW4571462.1 aldolase/citrate lyase family protein [Microbacterium arthrosphaerae]MDW7605317.1 aldolase/citrate lyase family protein [Microbacterium sp. M3]